MPFVKVSLWSGRTREQKAALAEALTQALVETGGIPREAVTVLFEDWPQENWATGGKPHDELFGKPGV